MDLTVIASESLRHLLDDTEYQLGTEDMNTRTWWSDDRPYGSIVEVEYTDKYEELAELIEQIEDELLTRECEEMI